MSAEFNTTHYGHAMRVERLAKNSREMAHMLANFVESIGHKRVALCYRGMSGVATATAVMMELMRWSGWRELVVPHITMVYVRKPHENSHGSDVEYAADGLDYNVMRTLDPTVPLIFCDDFVDSGETRAIVFAAVVKSQRDIPQEQFSYINEVDLYSLLGSSPEPEFLDHSTDGEVHQRVIDLLEVDTAEEVV